MNRPHIQAHAQVVGALSGYAPRHAPQVVYQEGHTSQINPPRQNPRNNFRDRSNRRKTTGFEEIRQEYYNIHQNKARAEPAEERQAQVHHGQSVHAAEDFFPKPSAFIKAPRRQIPPRRQRPANMDDDELIGGSNFMNRGSKAADMFQRRRERTDQFILDQENAQPLPAAHQTTPQGRQKILLTQSSWDASVPSPQPRSTMQPQVPVQSRRTPPPQSRPHHQPQQNPRQQQYQQQQQQQQQQRYPQQQQEQQQYHQQQQQHHQQQQQHHQQQRQPRQQPSRGHTTVDSRRSRQPLTQKSSRFELNSPWKDPNMPVGNRFHPNVVPYKDSYNNTPKGWGRASSNVGENNNIKEHYEYTDTSEKFRFSPAPRINKYGSVMATPSGESYNSRPKAWCDIELTASHPPPQMRRAYPSSQRHQSQSSVNQFTGQSSWGYGESDEL